ncbi:MAG: hypothetical protein ACOC80_14195 [Petrotogales bacterium]
MKRKLELFHNSDSLEFGGGTETIALNTGTYTKIISWKVPAKVGWSFIKNLKILMKLKNGSDEDLTENAKILLTFKRPAGEIEETMSSAKVYAPYKHLSITEQNNVDHDASTRFSLTRPGSLGEEAEIRVEVYSDSAFTVDWDHSEIYIRDVTEFDM